MNPERYLTDPKGTTAIHVQGVIYEREAPFDRLRAGVTARIKKINFNAKFYIVIEQELFSKAYDVIQQNGGHYGKKISSAGENPCPGRAPSELIKEI